MDLSFLPSRAGKPSCRAGSAWLHSRYDPESEAERFAADALGSRSASTAIIIGPCLGYLAAAVRRLLPRATIVTVQLIPEFKGKEVFAGDFSWYPDSGLSLDSYLYSAIGEDSISGVAVLSWPPAESAFPDAAREAASAVRIALDRLASSSATVKVFGKSWISNACRSFLLAETAAGFPSSGKAAVIAAAGPSLRPSLDALREHRGKYLLVAVSSALAACRSAGFEPDLVVSTDGGAWSRWHLYPLASRGAPLASPLTALPSASLLRRQPLLVLDQGSFAESFLVPLLGAPASAILKLPPHGTVSGTAFLLASRLCSGRLIAAGLDLARKGDHDHCSPHGFDFLAYSSSRRLQGEESSRWSRGLDSSYETLPGKAPWAASRSLAAYASGLDASLMPLRDRLYRLNPSPVRLGSFTEISASGVGDLFGNAAPSTAAPGGAPRIEKLAPAAKREKLLREVLLKWRSDARSGSEILERGQLADELPVAELLRSIDIVDYAAARRAVLSGGDPAPAALELKGRCEAFISDLSQRLVP